MRGIRTGKKKKLTSLDFRSFLVRVGSLCRVGERMKVTDVFWKFQILPGEGRGDLKNRNVLVIVVVQQGKTFSNFNRMER